MDKDNSEIKKGGLYISDGFINKVGKSEQITESADQIIDLEGHICLPGLINTHHHFYQTLTRCIPETQNSNLFNWLRTLYPIWNRLTPGDIFISTQLALAELALSGCTTAADHLYVFPNGSTLEDEIFASKELGLRLHASRGSMSIGERLGGLPPDTIIEDEIKILKDSQELIEKYHDPRYGSFLQIALAPCSPFSVSANLMRNTVEIARTYGVKVHTHLAETLDEEQYCMQKFGHRPVDYMKELGWMGSDVWFAHSVYVNKREILDYVKHKCGVAHCPTSNMRLGSGIAPISKMIRAGVKVGLGVDGSASNDGSHMLGEIRQAMLLSRLQTAVSRTSFSKKEADPFMTARQALHIATRGGASVLGRDDIGSLETGKCADFIAIKLDQIEFAGALSDPVAALVFCAPVKVNYSFIAGKPIIVDGELLTVDLPILIEKHNEASRTLIQGD
jgi:cytosine/adenosine deaminase-related metal-dependent hydrolase